ncbi:MAG: hypothetical protein JKX85_01870, partial [Phycisphaeraceae bacterium]|nr:hypothetical protein [Phycisphaeraceae bacterium]
DQVSIYVDSVIDLETSDLLGASRKSQGFGRDLFGASVFGSSVPGPGFGNGPFSPGPIGHDIDTATLDTAAEFVAGDYAIQTQGVDVLGNTGSLSSTATIQHRPTPPAPYNLAITLGTDLLTWNWQDPALIL